MWHCCCEYTLTIRRIRTIQLSRCCWNHARPWHASELVSFLVGLRTYQHPGIYSNSVHAYTINCKQYFVFLISNFRFFWILYVFFWVFPRRPIVICRRFGTLYQFHLQGLDVEYIQPLKTELIDGSETSGNHNRTPGKYPKNTYSILYVFFWVFGKYPKEYIQYFVCILLGIWEIPKRI